MLQLEAPETIVPGQPFTVRFQSETRVSGRLRLTHGTESLPFTLDREGREAVRSDGPRVRGKQGELVISDWGDHAPGTELVLRFEGAKVWLTVA